MKEAMTKSSEQQAEELAKSLADAKGADIRTYDVRGKSALADFFVVATGNAAPHLKAMIRELPKAYRVSGDPDSGWIVADYIDVVVHVFSPEARAYYALEKLWT